MLRCKSSFLQNLRNQRLINSCQFVVKRVCKKAQNLAFFCNFSQFLAFFCDFYSSFRVFLQFFTIFLTFSHIFAFLIDEKPHFSLKKPLPPLENISPKPCFSQKLQYFQLKNLVNLIDFIAKAVSLVPGRPELIFLFLSASFLRA